MNRNFVFYDYFGEIFYEPKFCILSSFWRNLLLKIRKNSSGETDYHLSKTSVGERTETSALMECQKRLESIRVQTTKSKRVTVRTYVYFMKE